MIALLGRALELCAVDNKRDLVTPTRYWLALVARMPASAEREHLDGAGFGSLGR